MTSLPRHRQSRFPRRGASPWWLIALGLACALLGALVGANAGRLELHIPRVTDVGRLKRSLLRSHREVPKVIYLAKDPLVLVAGSDSARQNSSSLVAATGQARAYVPGYTGSPALWERTKRCVEATFAGLDIEFTSRRPTDSTPYMMVAVGGHPKQVLGASTEDIAGLSPYTGDVVPSAVVFVFAARLNNRKRAVCNTIAHEVAHAYGLDHVLNCKDVMSYLPDCGPRYFREAPAPCGEDEPRECYDGAMSQKSYARLVRILGTPRRPGPAVAMR